MLYFRPKKQRTVTLDASKQRTVTLVVFQVREIQRPVTLIAFYARKQRTVTFVIFQARKANSGTMRMKRSLLVKAGEALAPDAFNLVLDSESSTKGVYNSLFNTFVRFKLNLL